MALEDKLTGAKRWGVDTLTHLTFYAPVMFTYEMARGMDLDQALHTRLTGAAVSIAVGGFKGQYRNLWYRLTKATGESTKLRRIMTDTLAAVTFQIPIYSGILYFNGVEPQNIPSMAIPGIALCTVLGRVFGMYQDRMRKYFGTRAAYEWQSAEHVQPSRSTMPG